MAGRGALSWRRASLVNRMVLVVALLLLAATSAGGALAYVMASSTIEEEIQFAGLSLGHSLASSIVTLVTKPGGNDELQMALNQLLEMDNEGRISDAYIVSSELLVLAAKDKAEVGRTFSRYPGLAAVESARAVRTPGFGTSIMAPVQWGQTNKRTLGYVVLFIGEKAFTAARNRILVSFALVFLLAVTVTVYLTRFVLQRLLRPVVALGEAARQLADGNSDYLLENPESEDEVGVATHSFLAMRDAQKIFVRFSNPALVRKIQSGIVPDRPEEVKLTIGFGDGVRFTDWSTAHTAAEISGMLTDYFTLFGLLVDHFDGIVEKFIGDAVMSYFGLHSERGAQQVARDAILTHFCGQLVLHTANEVFSRFHRRLPLYFRFGIATGKCVVGPMGAVGVKQDYTLIGNTVNLASRLEGVAQPGGLAIDNFTFQNAGGEAFLVVEGPHPEAIKGFSQPVPVYKVSGLRDAGEQERLGEFLLRFFTSYAVQSVLQVPAAHLSQWRNELKGRLLGTQLLLPTQVTSRQPAKVG